MKYLKAFENFDYDNIDANEEDYLYVQTSQIPNSGNGLFTSINIEKDEIVSKFIGEIISDEEAQKRADDNDDQYFMSLPSGEMLDCKRTKCFAKYANDAEGIPSKFKNNTFIAMDDDDDVVLVAKRDIKAGEEIFTGYGKEYWKKHGIGL
jgi:SET domain-containing protein